MRTDRPPNIVGRVDELADASAALGRVPAGITGVLLRGAAGIGKSTVWQAALDEAEARGWRVIAARPSAAETYLSFAGLTDLLAPVTEVALSDLPKPQRLALEVALLHESAIDEPPDARTTAAAVLGALHSLSKGSPLVIAIDDVQWLDAPTASALQFAVRRLSHEPIGLLVSERAQEGRQDQLALESSLAPERLTRIELEPLGVDDVARLLRAKLDLSLPRPMLLQAFAASAGNPFYALEIGRALLRGDRSRLTGEPLQLPTSLQEVVQDRLAALSDTALQVLLIVAATARPQIDLVLQAMSDPDAATAGVAEAERADVLAVNGTALRFTHPLLASTVYSSTPVVDRRTLHRRLAELASNSEERARHLALAADGPDRDVALALEEAAASARARGATDAAARLIEQAVDAARDEPAEVRRRLLLAAGEIHTRAGSARRAQDFLREALPLGAPGSERAEVLFQLAESVGGTDGARAAVEIYREALDEPGVGPEILSTLHREMSWYAMASLANPTAAATHARLAVSFAEEAGDPVLLMTALDYAAGVSFRFGQDDADSLRSRGLELEREYGDQVYAEARPSTTHAQDLVYADEIDRARPMLERLVEEADRAGDELGRCTPFFFLCQVEWRSGRWALARRYAEEAYEIILQAERTGELGAKLHNRALIYASSGELADARRTANEALEAAETMGSGYSAQRALGVLGFIELSEGRLEHARAALDRATAEFMASGVAEPGFARWIPDHVETLASLGDLEAAEPIVRWLEERGLARNRTWALAAAARGRGQILAARGDTDGALSAFRQAVELLESFGQPFEFARSLLALGATERRANQRRNARGSLARAVEILDDLPSPLWAERARRELSRIGGRTGGSDALTPTEREIAVLVATGLTNREVADRMFVAVRTVESNLSRAYGKLGVRSRTELAGKLHEG